MNAPALDPRLCCGLSGGRGWGMVGGARIAAGP